MPKYIDAEKIKITALALRDEDEDLFVSLEDVRKSIALTPVEEVVKVVRCKDCKYARHWYGNDAFSNTAYLCDYFIDGEEIKMFPEDFCSRGAAMDATEDGDMKIYDPKTQHINADLADRCNHGTR